MKRRRAFAASTLLLVACHSSNVPDIANDAPTPLPLDPPAQAVPFAPTPDPDPFYAQPDPMPDVPPGTVLKSRAVTFAPGTVPEPNPAWQLQYMTRDVDGRPLAAVTTVVSPMVPAAVQPAPLVSYQFAYNSLGGECTPSHTLTGGTDNGNVILETGLYIAGLQTQGWTMVFPDFEGPYHAYGVGRLAGQAVLDSIRAALSFAPLGLTDQTPVGMWGYSGGALATSWAATLQPSYAPELNLVATASGGTPTDVFAVMQAGEDTNFFPLIFSVIVGTNRAYPQLMPEAILNDAGRAAAEAVRDGCVGAGGPNGKFADFTTVADPYATPGAIDVRQKLLLPQAGMHPTTDLFIFHEVLDELVPVAGTDALVEAWCAAGTPISYQRSLTGEHVTGLATHAALALAYLVGRFSGAPAPVVPPAATSCNR